MINRLKEDIADKLYSGFKDVGKGLGYGVLGLTLALGYGCAKEPVRLAKAGSTRVNGSDQSYELSGIWKGGYGPVKVTQKGDYIEAKTVNGNPFKSAGEIIFRGQLVGNKFIGEHQKCFVGGSNCHYESVKGEIAKNGKIIRIFPNIDSNYIGDYPIEIKRD